MRRGRKITGVAAKPIAIKPATHVEMTKAGFVFNRDQLVRLEQPKRMMVAALQKMKAKVA